MSDAQSLAEAAVARIAAQTAPRIDPEAAAALKAAPRPTLTMRKILALYAYLTGHLQDALDLSQAIFQEQPASDNAKTILLVLRRMGRTHDGLAFARRHKDRMDPIVFNDAMAMLCWDAGDGTAAAQHGTRSLELKDAQGPAAPELTPRTAPVDLSRPRRNIIAFSQWGDDNRYLTGAVNNAIVARYLYPGWMCRFYVDRSVPDTALADLMAQGAQVMLAPPEMPAGRYGPFWRFLVEDDETVAVFLCRDADAVMNIKERVAVQDWLTSGRAFHVMRDRPTQCELMLAGMWGAHRGNIGAMRDRIDAYLAARPKQINDRTADQEFLRTAIWPIARQDVLAHDAWLDFGTPRRFCADFDLPPTYHIGQNDWVHTRPIERTAGS